MVHMVCCDTRYATVAESMGHVCADKVVAVQEYRESRIEHYRAMGEDYSDAIAWAAEDTKAYRKNL